MLYATKIAGETRRPGAPHDWDPAIHGECGALPIRDETYPGGLNGMVSEWHPTPAEIRALQNGAPILLTIIGSVHPPVSLNVGPVPGKAVPPAPVAAGERV